MVLGGSRLECRFELVRAEKGYQVRFHTGDTPVKEQPFVFDLSSSLNQRYLAAIHNGSIDMKNLRELGTRLWNALRPAEFRAPFEELALQASTACPMRVWLDIPPEEEVEQLPWEALHDAPRSSFLGTDRCFCLLRAPPVDCPPAELPPPREGALRVLVLIPQGSALPGVEYELNNLQQIIRQLGGALELELVEGRVTTDRIQSRLEAGPWDVLHFIGHGEAGEQGVTLRLNAEDSEEAEAWLDAPTFASLLQGQQLRLALFNCCLGAAPSVSRILSGLGPHLMRKARIPAVISMRYEISDRVSIRFAKVLYQKLLTGHSPGRVDVAIQEARLSLAGNASGDAVRGFITPVLHLSPLCERLFVVPEPSSQPHPPTGRTSPRVLLPDSLVRSLGEGLCIPVVGPTLHPEDSMRRTSSAGETPAPALAQLIHALAHESHFPEEQELPRLEDHPSGDWLLPLLLARVCEHYQAQDSQRLRLIRSLQKACAHAQPPLPLRLLARWSVPGIFYLHFDGMMEMALTLEGKTFQVINQLDRPGAGKSPGLVLVNVVGTLADVESLALTEEDLERLRWEALPRPSESVLKLAQVLGRSFLFLGVSPRDLLVRRMKSLLQAGPRQLQGRTFFVTPHASPVDEAYWKPFDIQWIHEDPTAVIEELTRRAVQEGGGP